VSGPLGCLNTNRNPTRKEDMERKHRVRLAALVGGVAILATAKP
jgi:hypothetical protein